MAQAPALPTGFELPLERRLPRIGSIDQVAIEERAGTLAKRSIKREAKVFALELAVRTTDLTTLEGADTPGKIAALASKAVRPDPSDPGIPSVAALCVYPNLVPTAVERLRGTDVKVACGDAHLKVILETGELGPYDTVRRASLLAMAAGGDFIKTSTGKLPSAATLPVALVMLEAIRDVYGRPAAASASRLPGGSATPSRPSSTWCSSTRRSASTG